MSAHSRGCSRTVHYIGQAFSIFVLTAFLCAIAPASPAQSQPAPVKLCVAMPINTSNYPVNTRLQQSRLLRDFNGAKKDKKGKLATIEAVGLQARGRNDAEPEARDKGCAYLLSINVVSLRAPGDAPQPNSPGTVSIGRGDPINVFPGGTSSHDPVFETQVNYELYTLDEVDPLLSSSSNVLEHDTEDGVVTAALDIIVNRVRAVVGSRNRG